MSGLVKQIYIAILMYGYKAKNLYITYDEPYIVYGENRPGVMTLQKYPGVMTLQEYIDSLNK